MTRTAAVAIASVIVVLALAGCVRITIAPSPAAVAPPAVAAAAPAVVSAPPVVDSTPSTAPAPESPPGVAPPVALAAPAPAPATAPAPKTVSKASAPPKIAAPPPPIVVPPPPVKAPPSTLDLAALETRLRATAAIGVFTKLTLKNQITDLLDQFKTFHHGGAPPLTTLRQAYEVLLLKVLSLLQDHDASLASAISASRESIWRILVDPAKFAKLG